MMTKKNTPHVLRGQRTREPGRSLLTTEQVRTERAANSFNRIIGECSYI